MSGTILEARAIITAEDKTAAAFAAIEKRMAALSAAAEQVGRMAKSSSSAMEVARVSTPFAQAERAVNSYSQALAQAATASREFAAAQKNLGPAMELGSRRAKVAQTMHGAQRFAGAATMLATPFVAHKAEEIAASVATTYRDFDNLRRYQKAILNLTDEQQKPLVDQAIHMGSTTKFNDLQVLQAQLDLAQRRVKQEFIRPFVEKAADYATAMDTSLPEAVKTLEGQIFSTGKHIEDAGDAMRVMGRTVDFSVKLAKIGGLDDEDVKQFYKYGGQPGAMAGLSDEFMGAAVAAMRRSNIRGDEGGVAMRTFAAKLVSPSKKGMDALDALGVDYNQFAKLRGGLTVDVIGQNFKRKFGQELTESDRTQLAEVLEDPDQVRDRAAFVAATSEILGGHFLTKKGKPDARSARELASNMESLHKLASDVDAEGLARAIMAAHPSLAQANALFTSQQGGRILSFMKSPELFNEYYTKLKEAPEGFAASIGAQRMAGFDGAVSRFEGAIKNFETAMGRAYDKPLTQGTNMAAEALQKFNELPDEAHRAAGALAAVATAAVTVSGVLRAISGVDQLLGGKGFNVPGVGKLGGLFWKGSMLAGLATNLYDMDSAGKNLDQNKSLIAKGEDWAREHLPAFMTDRANDWAREHLLGGGAVGSYKDRPSGYYQDFTMGSSGGFAQSGHLQPPSNMGFLSDWSIKHSAPGLAGQMRPFEGVQEVNVTGSATVEFSPVKFEATSEFIRIVNDAKAAAKQIPLSPTGHSPAALGASLPEAGTGANR